MGEPIEILEKKIMDILWEEISSDVYWDGASNLSGLDEAAKRIINEIIVPTQSIDKPVT